MKEDLRSLIQKIAIEKRIPSIAELVAVLEEVDTNSEASRIMKRTIISTLGFGQIGCRYPVTFNNATAWCDLVNYYLKIKNELGGDHSFTKNIRTLVTSSTFDLVSRSFTKENSSELFDYLCKKWHISY